MKSDCCPGPRQVPGRSQAGLPSTSRSKGSSQAGPRQVPGRSQGSFQAGARQGSQAGPRQVPAGSQANPKQVPARSQSETPGTLGNLRKIVRSDNPLRYFANAAQEKNNPLTLYFQPRLRDCMFASECVARPVRDSHSPHDLKKNRQKNMEGVKMTFAKPCEGVKSMFESGCATK